jgi:hypothetical protein
LRIIKSCSHVIVVVEPFCLEFPSFYTIFEPSEISYCLIAFAEAKSRTHRRGPGSKKALEAERKKALQSAVPQSIPKEAAFKKNVCELAAFSKKKKLLKLRNSFGLPISTRSLC